MSLTNLYFIFSVRKFNIKLTETTVGIYSKQLAEQREFNANRQTPLTQRFSLTRRPTNSLISKDINHETCLRNAVQRQSETGIVWWCCWRLLAVSHSLSLSLSLSIFFSLFLSPSCNASTSWTKPYARPYACNEDSTLPSHRYTQSC